MTPAGQNHPTCYQNLDYYVIDLQGAVLFKTGIQKNIYLETRFRGAKSHSATTYDSDYLYDNRVGQFSRSQSDSTGSTAVNFDFIAGYQLTTGSAIPQTTLEITPMVAYTYNKQDIKMQQGVQLECSSPCNTQPGPISGLDSSYDTTWYGGWYGGNLGLRFGLGK